MPRKTLWRNPITKKWGDEYTYGGKLTENCVQGIARDIMAEAMLRLEANNYKVILTVHDEVIAEVPKTHGKSVWDEKKKSFTDPEFNRLMAINPEWADGCPIAVDGWRGPRYKK